MSAGPSCTDKLHVSWSFLYWQVTCQLELLVLASYQLQLDVLASYISAAPPYNGTSHVFGSRMYGTYVSWSLAYWQVTCQLELSVLGSHMSAGAYRTGKSHVSWSLPYWQVTCQLKLDVMVRH